MEEGGNFTWSMCSWPSFSLWPDIEHFHQSLGGCKQLCTQEPGPRAPCLIGTSSQLGKVQVLPCAEHLFSLCGGGFDHHDSTSFSRLCTDSAELYETVQAQNSEVFSEAPESYSFFCQGQASGIDAYVTASALASGLSPKIGMAPWHTSSDHHTNLLPFIQTLIRP